VLGLRNLAEVRAQPARVATTGCLAKNAQPLQHLRSVVNR
jgi:hypothetical protein